MLVIHDINLALFVFEAGNNMREARKRKNVKTQTRGKRAGQRIGNL